MSLFQVSTSNGGSNSASLFQAFASKKRAQKWMRRVDIERGRDDEEEKKMICMINFVESP